MADDEGRFIASTNAINGYVFPHDHLTNLKVKKLLNELVFERFVEIYEENGLTYGSIVTFKKHQRINRKTPSIHPPPPSQTQKTPKLRALGGHHAAVAQ
jgi:hypothetical protein